MKITAIVVNNGCWSCMKPHVSQDAVIKLSLPFLNLSKMHVKGILGDSEIRMTSNP